MKEQLTEILKKISEENRVVRDYTNRVLGISQIPFCLEKLVLEYRLQRPIKMNGNMFLGIIMHRHLFNDLVKKTFKGLFNKEFEKSIETEVQGFKLVGHVDCYIKRPPMIIEFKTTDMQLEHSLTNPLTKAYLMQANAYASILDVDTFQIWILNKRFDDVENAFSIISGERDQNLYEKVIERAKLVINALDNNKDITACPEFDWECRNCSFQAECPKMKVVSTENVELPSEFRKADLTPAQLVLFEQLKNNYKYDKSKRKYVKVV